MEKCVSFFLSSIFLWFLWTCDNFDDSNPLDPEGKNYKQNKFELEISADTLRIIPLFDNPEADTLVKYLGQQINTENGEREKRYEVWTKNESWLALEYNGTTIAGDPEAVNIGIIKLNETRKWLAIEKKAENQRFTVSWWHQPDTLRLAYFENFRSRRNELKGIFGSWNLFPGDPTQGAIEFDAPDEGYNNGNCLKIEYDVDSPNPAICGTFFKLTPDSNGTRSLSGYEYINLFLRGDAVQGFSKTLQIELKGPEPEDFFSDWAEQKKARFIIEDIDLKWKQCIIPLAKFVDWPGHAPLESYEAVHEFTITFADDDVDPDAKTGAIYIDDIFFLEYLPYNESDTCKIIGDN